MSARLASIATRLAAVLVFAGALVAMMPAVSDATWARATFTGSDSNGHLIITMSAGGAVKVNEGGDPDLTELYEKGPTDASRAQVYAGGRAALSHAVPATTRNLIGWLAGGLLAAAVVIAAARTTRVRVLWPLVGSGALVVLVVGVMLRQATTGALGSWLASLNLADLGVEATAPSSLPVVGALLALAGAVAGSLIANNDGDNR